MKFKKRQLKNKTKEEMLRKKEVKQYEKNQKRDIVRKRSEENREMNHPERNQNRENETDECDSLGTFF